MLERKRAAIILLLAMTGGTLAFADGVIHNLRYWFQGDILAVSFRLRGGVDEDISQKIKSGEKTGFRYDLELIERKTFWLGHSVTHLSLTTEAVYDTLTRKYSLILLRGDEPIAAASTGQYDEAERWLTSINDARLVNRSLLHPQTRYTLRARAHLGTRFYFYVVPWEETTEWESVDFKTP